MKWKKCLAQHYKERLTIGDEVRMLDKLVQSFDNTKLKHLCSDNYMYIIKSLKGHLI
jgi:hypothetical protein